MSKTLRKSAKHPNKSEIFLNNIIQKISSDFIYSGNGKFWVAGKNPDWFNVNGKKQVIEMLGDYWHSEKLTGRSKEQEEDYLKDHYAKYGYDCLIIWEHELKDERIIQALTDMKIVT